MKKVYFSTDLKYTTPNGNTVFFNKDTYAILEDTIATEITNIDWTVNTEVIGKVALLVD